MKTICFLLGFSVFSQISAVEELSDQDRDELRKFLSEDFKRKAEQEDNSQTKRLISLAAIYVNQTVDSVPEVVSDELFKWYENTLTVSVGMRSTCAPDCGSTFDFSEIFEYGCWCNMGDRAGRGGGKPMDAFDEVCKSMTHCYRCAIMDGENENEPCTPWDTAYEASFNHLLGDEAIQATCRTKNVENCAWRACSCEMGMIAGFLKLAFDPNNVFNPLLKHDVFNYASECTGNGTPGMRECCGMYPKRRFFNADNGRLCCNEKTIYNPAYHQCCSDGGISSLGNIC